MREATYFEQVVAKGCGLDVHKETVVATVSGTGIKSGTRTFSTFTRSLTELREWILSLGVTHLAMESRGMFRKPVFDILEGYGLAILVARNVLDVPGHKKLIGSIAANRNRIDRTVWFGGFRPGRKD